MVSGNPTSPASTLSLSLLFYLSAIAFFCASLKLLFSVYLPVAFAPLLAVPSSRRALIRAGGLGLTGTSIFQLPDALPRSLLCCFSWTRCRLEAVPCNRCALMRACGFGLTPVGFGLALGLLTLAVSED